MLAYVKVHWDAAERELANAEAAAAAVGTADPHLRLPRVLAHSLPDQALAYEPLGGDRLDGIDDLTPALRALGAALATLHDVRPLPARRFDRLDPERLALAAEVVGRARPDCARAAAALHARLAGGPPDSEPVHLHGDANLRNALLDGGRVGLVDLEDAAAGPAAADLGFVIAGLLARRRGERVGAARRVFAPRAGAVGGRPALACRRLAARAHRGAGGGPHPAGAARAPEVAAGAGGMSERPALLWYCQHSVGLGHLVRSSVVCAALAERFRVLLLCGGALPEGFRPPAGVQVLALPPLGVGESGGFVSHDPRYSLEQAWVVRRERILAAYRAVRPAAVVVELFPFGRAKFARELVPLLEAARADGALTACSLRDILVSARADQQAHDDRAAALAEAHLDAVLVHSDPEFARLEETFAPREPLQVPVHYTGFVVREGGGPAERGGHVLVSAGGGRVGEPLLRAAAEAQPDIGVPLRLIGGPLLPDGAWERLRALEGPQVELRRTVADLGEELCGARASVSQGGYNTALEVVRSGTPGLLVPYATPEEDEQLRRARRLERLGAVRVLAPDRLAPTTLAAEVRRLLGFEPRPASVDLDGAGRTAALLEDLVAEPQVTAGRA